MERWFNTKTNRFNMIRTIVEAIALGCVTAGITLGAILIIESTVRQLKDK
jgi:hypothetical protein